MKHLITSFLLLLTSQLLQAQTYMALITKADKHYQSKTHNEALPYYRQAFKLRKDKAGHLYQAACAAALAGDKKQALKWLNQALKAGWLNVKHMQDDKDLASLHTEKGWTKLVAKMSKQRDALEAGYDHPLRDELLALLEADQGIRRASEEARVKHGLKNPISDSIRVVMRHQDSINIIRVKEILDTKGWVGADKIGSKANQTLFLVIQHSDLATQQKYLPMMRQAVKDNRADKSSLALLEDRVALGEGRKQLYGSQIAWDRETGIAFVRPLEDPDHVDERRESVDLGPIADYVSKWKITWNVEEYKKWLAEQEKK